VDAPVIAGADLLELAAGRRLSTFLGAARDVPAVVVPFDDVAVPGGHELERTELGTLPVVLIGVGALDHPLAAVVDVVVGDEHRAERLVDAVAEQPSSSVALALLLRHSAGRSIPAGLVAESTTYSMLQGGAGFRTWQQARLPVRSVPVDEPSVLVRREGDVVHVTLNRPERHNAVDADMSERLVAVFTDVLAEPSVRAVVRGAGRSFSSGGDLDEFGSFPSPVAAHAIRLSRSAGHLVALLADRVEFRLHGMCLGAGIELPAFAGRVVGAADTIIGLPERGLGLVPGAGGTVSLPARIGRHRTALLALTGERIDAGTALAWGLLDAIE
jgi:hypothetical protein